MILIIIITLITRICTCVGKKLLSELRKNFFFQYQPDEYANIFTFIDSENNEIMNIQLQKKFFYNRNTASLLQWHAASASPSPLCKQSVYV